MPQLFGAKLRYLRRAQGITQVELAQRLGLASHPHITKLETGQRTASLTLIVRVAELFNVSTDYLLRDTIPTTNVTKRFIDRSPDKQLPFRFSNNLRALRLQQQLSQTDLAQQLGIARRGYISNLETGRKIPSPDLVVLIADQLGTTTDELLCGTYSEE